ncbi:Uncharacterized protein dnm_011210 [Desulfonema magnum]|uniref:Uncharacterized protein n=1 Tax=Desulfonema magnum TaxID=45655 RepID=A0A975BGJ8_9BACT|nr:Uncharacterized protein dnm_011210 [Desulfonema magnum]
MFTPQLIWLFLFLHKRENQSRKKRKAGKETGLRKRLTYVP